MYIFAFSPLQYLQNVNSFYKIKAKSFVNLSVLFGKTIMSIDLKL